MVLFCVHQNAKILLLACSKVFDYDWGLQDDFMGSAKLDLRTIELNRPQELVIKLEDQSRPFRSLGELKINITLWPKTQEDKEQVHNCSMLKYCLLAGL